eukprot:CAMPEP_0201592702 /NCGR_PEP_ID=MMETSP0190_2-20130828/190529_1 /ASSEMBLY_ACC=CAM_ASM_000263 /TAXON_ID=37353 /ORGANISM="Rosalina sp." /LENGTH=756 /DNA_ID=CAMNT_0048051599 /DNA_START=59 /DNA_END=2327 /DNA_ORIENTATION=-
MVSYATVIITFANILATIANADICITGTSTTNTAFFGNYQQNTDDEGNIYYEKDQVFCDDQPEYLYLTNEKWQTNQELNGNGYSLLCPDENIASPDLCTAGTWMNTGSIDSTIQVTANACPVPDSTPSLGCDYILLQDSGNANNNIQNGLYTKIGTGDNLYQKDSYLFQYSKLSQSWIIAEIDIRESCQNPSYYFKSTDTDIDGLSVGDENVEIDITYPVQDGDYSCKQPKISCLDSVPTAEVLNNALCNLPCNLNPPSLECDYILLQDSGNANSGGLNGLFTKVANEDDLYQKDSYLFQYSKVSQSWIIAESDERESCQNPSYFFKSTDTTIDGLSVGDANENIAITYPVQDGDYSCKQPKISCLDSEPTDEELNNALCNLPCNINPPSLSCSYIEIDIQGGNYGSDGIYNKIDNNLYQMGEYYFLYYVQGGYYAITKSDDRNLCGNTGPTAYLRSFDSNIDTLQNGNSITASLDHPASGTATINCLAQPPTAAPVPAAPNGLCVAVTDNLILNSVLLTDIAGTYSLMSQDINGQPAYELQTGCGTPAYIAYDDVYPYYFLSTNGNDPYPSGFITYCTNTASINNDISQCVWQTPPNWNGGDLVEVTSGGGCACGTVISASPIIMSQDINGQPAYELQTGCGTAAYIVYHGGIYPYYFLTTNDNNILSGWFAYCTNTASISNDISQCVWSSDLVEVTSGGGCACGITFDSGSISPNGEPVAIKLKFPNENIVIPSTDPKPVGIWSQFMDILHTEW